MAKIQQFFTEALAELHQVRWPTRQQAVRLALIVIAFIAVATAIFGVLDFGLDQAVQLLLNAI